MTDQMLSRTEALEREAAKLRKINAALMSRVERSTDQQMNAFSLFETAIAIDQQVRDRTQQLKTALQSMERTNGQLFQAKQQAEAASSLKSSILISVTHDLLQPAGGSAENHGPPPRSPSDVARIRSQGVAPASAT